MAKEGGRRLPLASNHPRPETLCPAAPEELNLVYSHVSLKVTPFPVISSDDTFALGHNLTAVLLNSLKQRP